MEGHRPQRVEIRCVAQPERWLSGRKQRFAKPSYGQKLYRGFESPPLRQLSNFASFSSKLFEKSMAAEFDSCRSANGFFSDLRNSPPFRKASSETKPKRSRRFAMPPPC